MKAVRCKEFGPPESLVVEDILAETAHSWSEPGPALLSDIARVDNGKR